MSKTIRYYAYLKVSLVLDVDASIPAAQRRERIEEALNEMDYDFTTNDAQVVVHEESIDDFEIRKDEL